MRKNIPRNCEGKRLNQPFKSNRESKKLQVCVKDSKNNKVVNIHFGQKGYEDYTQHRDKDRRRNYLTRSAGIRDKEGNLTKDNKLSANYWARKVLW